VEFSQIKLACWPTEEKKKNPNLGLFTTPSKIHTDLQGLKLHSANQFTQFGTSSVIIKH